MGGPLRLLGVYDNKPFGKRLSFYDTMVLARKKYEQSYMDPNRPGRFRKPEKKTAGEFQAWLGSVCDARSATARSNYSSFVNYSEQIWGLLVQLMLGQVKNPTKIAGTISPPPAPSMACSDCRTVWSPRS